MNRTALLVLLACVLVSTGCRRAPEPCPIPGAASGLRVVSNGGGTVVLAWTPAANAPTSYILEAGSTPGKSDLTRIDLHSPESGYTATGVKAGTYHTRVTALNACGSGPASNEIIAVVP